MKIDIKYYLDKYIFELNLFEYIVQNERHSRVMQNMKLVWLESNALESPFMCVHI